MMDRSSSRVGGGVHFLKNARLYKQGEIQRRLGFEKKTTGSAAVLAIFAFYDPFNGYSAVVAENDGTLEQSSL